MQKFMKILLIFDEIADTEADGDRLARSRGAAFRQSSPADLNSESNSTLDEHTLTAKDVRTWKRWNDCGRIRGCL